jgi:hypothetical protein
MFRNTAKTFVLLAGLAALMVGIGSLFGRGGAIIGFALGLAIVGFSYWKSARQHAHAAAVRLGRSATQRVCDRTQPGSRRSRYHGGPHCCVHVG